MKNLIQSLKNTGVLKTPKIIEAFSKIKRSDFLPHDVLEFAELDEALPTFKGQTISQPYTVAFMLELLDAESGQKILDVGSGSGWVTALLAELVGPKGCVYAIERIPKLVDFSKQNLLKYNMKNIDVILGDGARGLPEYAPYDRIHAAASAKKIPKPLLDQLAIGGKMVIPLDAGDIRLIEKKSEKRYNEKIYPGFVFVPLLES